MIRKILKSKRAEGYLDVVIGVVALVMFIVIALNIFTFVTLKTTIDRIADDLIEVATFSGSFGDDFNDKVDQLKNKYFDFEVETYVEKYYNAEHKRVQIGDDMGFTIRVNASVAGISIALPIDVTASRIGQSEQYWKPATGIYETPPVEDNSWKPWFVLNTKSHKFHYPDCSSVKSISTANRLDIQSTATELIELGYDPCGICDPHDCSTTTAVFLNINGHWGTCDTCGKESVLEKHSFVYSNLLGYYHCVDCHAFKDINGKYRCAGGTMLTEDPHVVNCDCDTVPPVITLDNLSTKSFAPTKIVLGVFRITGTATDKTGNVTSLTINEAPVGLDAEGNWYFDYNYTTGNSETIQITAIDDEGMETTVTGYIAMGGNGIINGYYYVDGVRTSAGLIEINGDYYYASNGGLIIMNKNYWVSTTNGLVEVGRYRFDAEGKMIKTTEVACEDGEYHYYVDGKRYTGQASLIEWQGNWYYVDGGGNCAANKTCYVVNPMGLSIESYIRFDSEAKMIMTTEVACENGNYYYYENGLRSMGKAGLIECDGNYYYVDGGGACAANKTVWISNTNGFGVAGAYRFGADAKMIMTTEVVNENGTYCYYKDGMRAAGAGLIYWNGHYYLIDGGGYCATNKSAWVGNTNGLVTAGTYRFDSEAKMIMDTAVVNENGTIYYYLNGKRTANAGLVLYEGNYYHIGAGAKAATNETVSVTKTNGLMPTGTYTFDENGKMIL